MIQKNRKKKCRQCGQTFTPGNTMQKVCSLPCAVEYSKQETKKNEAGMNQLRNEKIQVEKLQTAIIRTEKLVHEYVRLRDKYRPCISCGTQYKRDFQAGHRFSRKQFNAIRYDTDNIHGQCRYCNEVLNGN